MKNKPKFIKAVLCTAPLMALPFISAPAMAALDCSGVNVQTGQELVNPPELNANRGVLQTVLVAGFMDHCVPVLADDGTWSAQSMKLRNYGWTNQAINLTNFKESDLANLSLTYTYPGPTLRLRKATSPEVNNGDRLQINLYNHLDPTTPHDAMQCTGGGTDAPNCYHGADVTNLHFHGSHVSPQPNQDYVLVKVYPKGSTGVTEDVNNTVGDYQIRVDALNYRQPEGSHWYHPHKHGSTALQVNNGQAGALIVEGALDDWLHNYYKDVLVEKTMVVQQIAEEVSSLSYALVNGQPIPKVTMKKGEVQRFRLIGALMNNAAKYTIQFPAGFDVKQIEQDGVQFSPKNYANQPLRANSGGYVFKLDPGNRVDLLVQAPTTAGTYAISHKMVGELSGAQAKSISNRNRKMKRVAKQTNTSSDPELFTVVVGSETKNMGGLPDNADWPALPAYLQTPTNISKTQTVSYASNSYTTGTGPSFTVQGAAYEGQCVMDDFTTTLNTTEKWKVINQNLTHDGSATSKALPTAAHPFHIHTNPFLLTRFGDTVYDGNYDPIWMDTISLPTPTTGGPDDPATSVDVLLHFEDFTGGYVNHCHFLNHEDQGMMQLVQTVCPPNSSKTTQYGTPGSNVVECSPTNPRQSSLPVCP